MMLAVKSSFYDRAAGRPRFVGERFEVDDERGVELMEKVGPFIERVDAPDVEREAEPHAAKPKRTRKKVAQ